MLKFFSADLIAKMIVVAILGLAAAGGVSLCHVCRQACKDCPKCRPDACPCCPACPCK